jgi:anti-sigma factor RsiW
MSLHIENWLDAYVDRELSAEKRSAVDSHLATCETCRQALDRRQMLSALLQEWPAVDGLAPAAEQARRVRARIEANRPAEVRRSDRRAEQRLHWAWAALPLMLVASWAFWATASIVAPLLEAIPSGAQALAAMLPAIQIEASAFPLDAALSLDLQTLALPAAAWLGASALVIALALLYLAWMSLLLARQRTVLKLNNE